MKKELLIGTCIILFLAFSLCGLGVMIYVPGEDIRRLYSNLFSLIWYAGIALTCLFVMGLSLSLAWGMFSVFVKGRIMLNDARKQEIVIQTASPKHQVFAYHVPSGGVRNLHLTVSEEEERRWYYLNQPKQKQEKEEMLALPHLSVSEPLLPLAISSQRVLVVGPQNSGKTTLMQHIALLRCRQGQVIVLDSHDFPAKWPMGCQVVGNGREYGDIRNAMGGIISLMDARYKEYSKGDVGEREHELLTIVCDEWTLLPEYISDIDDFLRPILTESRKVGIDFVCGTHSERARALGLKGSYDLKANFDIIVRLKTIGTDRRFYVDFGEGEREYLSPGIYNPAMDDTSYRQPYVIDTSLTWQLTTGDGREGEILKLNEAGVSDTGITVKVYGQKGGKQLELVREVLRRYGRL